MEKTWNKIREKTSHPKPKHEIQSRIRIPRRVRRVFRHRFRFRLEIWILQVVNRSINAYLKQQFTIITRSLIKNQYISYEQALIFRSACSYLLESKFIFCYLKSVLFSLILRKQCSNFLTINVHFRVREMFAFARELIFLKSIF